MEGLVHSQIELYGRIVHSFENLKKAGPNITLGLAEARLQALDRNWSKFESQHDMLLANHWDALADFDYRKKDMQAVTEEAYLQQKGLYLDALRTLKSITAPENPVVASEVPHPPRTTLPRIQLPQFSGRYEEWPSFRDPFNSIIGKDISMTQVEKLHYLKSCLKGEAELLICNLPTTDENFNRAWKAMTDYFDNKRLLVRSYISQFTTLSKLKGESASDLRHLYHGVMSIVGSMESIGRSITHGEDLFVHLILDLLDSRSRRDWENSISETTEPPSYAALLKFLDRRLHTLEALQPVKIEASSSKTSSGFSRQTRALHTRKQVNKLGRCSLCREDHYIMLCDVYQGKTAEEKGSISRLIKTCTTCHARHHTSLHDAFHSVTAKVSHVMQKTFKSSATVLLATARVSIADRFGIKHTARALVDQGSETSLVSESLAQRLKLARSPSSVTVYGVGGVQSGHARGLVSLQISALNGGASMSVSALVFPKLTVYEGKIKADRRAWTHLYGLELADPDFLAADPVEILLGADVYVAIFQEGLRKGGPLEPVAQQTSLGWILSGTVESTTGQSRTLSLLCRTEEDLISLVRRFWQQEELPIAATPLTPEDQECEDFFLRTYSRISDGRYVVRLPIIKPLPDFSSTRFSALRVLSGMEKKFIRDARLHQLYSDFMRQYKDLGHMTAVYSAQPERRFVNYLPHHGVMREASVTTKLRVVFNGSTMTPAGDSLNSRLMVGPSLLPSLADVLLRWRLHRYVFATDVEKMYRQILVHEEDRDLQRIIWRYNNQDNYTMYRLNTITYGLSCAPFLAIRTLRQLAIDEQEQYPRRAVILRRDVYMDDVLSGAATIEEAKDLQQQLIGLCLAGGLPLRKWSANDNLLLKDIPEEHKMKRELRAWQPHETHSTLGLQWHPATDDFSFVTRTISKTIITKRSVLSLTAKLFDPLGWLAPAVVKAKIAFQGTWLQGLDWDAPLDDVSTRQWQDYQEELPQLEKIRVPRWIGLVHLGADAEVHGFSDVSERAYAAVLYFRTKIRNSWRTTLLLAKTKVAPIKQVTLPRLELCAATLLARLAAHARTTLGFVKISLHCWTDSTVALGWIRGHPTKWKTYVANRVAEIQTSVPDTLWHHIPGRDNPADCASRGLAPSELVYHKLWWQGPSWLMSEASSWPDSSSPSSNLVLPEVRIRSHVAKVTPSSVTEPDELLRFSSLHRLLRVTAWCRRWLRRRRLVQAEPDNHSRDSLTTDDLEDARLLWIQRVQAENFKSEIETIQQGCFLSKTHALTRLSPFSDSQGILRVGGRLKHAILAFDERHPVILPSDSHFTRLVVEACHRRALHGGVQLTLGMIRQRY